MAFYTYASFWLILIGIALIIAWIVSYAAKRRMEWWDWLLMIAGFVFILIGLFLWLSKSKHTPEYISATKEIDIRQHLACNPNLIPSEIVHSVDPCCAPTYTQRTEKVHTTQIGRTAQIGRTVQRGKTIEKDVSVAQTSYIPPKPKNIKSSAPLSSILPSTTPKFKPLSDRLTLPLNDDLNSITTTPNITSIPASINPDNKLFTARSTLSSTPNVLPVSNLTITPAPRLPSPGTLSVADFS